MAYDPAHGSIVLFGGADLTGNVGDTWRLANGTWTQVPTTGPSARTRAGMTFDPIRRAMVLYGGDDSSGVIADPWILDGNTWSPIAASQPGLLESMEMATDTARGRAILVGGTTPANTAQTKTWTLSSTAWVADPAGTVLPGLIGHAAAFDSLRGRAVVFGGGASVGAESNTTLELHGNEWFAGATNGPARAHASLAYDAARGVTVMFGGDNGGNEQQETWTYDGTTWTNHNISPSASPDARADAGMVYDAKHGEVVLYGGNANSGAFGDTWVWNGTAWTQRTPAHSPPPLTGTSMTYDPIRERVVLFGGIPQGVSILPSDATWEWDGTDWTQVMVPGPLGREYASMAWDPDRRRVVLFGGVVSPLTPANDTWEFDGTAWAPLPIPTAPSPRLEATLVPSSDGSALVLVGGSVAANGAGLAEAWRLRWQSGAPDDACDQSDFDHDTLVGCADPDCWAVCTPLCPPGAACDPAAPRCGDAQCSGLETCRSCPQDCTCAAVCGDFACDASETHASCPGDCP